jgi:hypothetical protein
MKKLTTLFAVLGVVLALAPFTLLAAPQPDCVVVFNEVHYNPIGATEDGEWLELFNQMGIMVDLSGWRLSGGIDYTFPAGTIISNGAYLVVYKTPAGGELGPFTGSLNNAGETINLRNHSNRLMDSLGYGDSGRWPLAGHRGRIGNHACQAQALHPKQAPRKLDPLGGDRGHAGGRKFSVRPSL